MAFYHFSQNNSGGSFHIDPERGIGPNVWIEADSAEEANERAQAIGIYFDGVDADIDCPCCGDRWTAVDESDWFRADRPQVSLDYDFTWHNEIYAHLKDGRIDKLTLDEAVSARDKAVIPFDRAKSEA